MNVFDKLQKAVIECGNTAAHLQSGILRSFKKDGSVLTEADIYVDRQLRAAITALFPDDLIISEETESIHPAEIDSKVKHIFVLDPIDGTDAYSQGMPSWCVALGILNRNYQPVGSMIYAPLWMKSTLGGMFIRLDPKNTSNMQQLGNRLLLNGIPFNYTDTQSNEVKQMVVSSKLHSHVDLRRFNGKCRNFGSNILHLVSPVIHKEISVAISSTGFIWDIVASHAVLLYCNLQLLRVSNGEPFNYSEHMLQRKPCKDILIAGTYEHCKQIMSLLF